MKPPEPGADRNLIEALSRLSRDAQAPPDFFRTVMARADRLGSPRRTFLNRFATWFTGPWPMGTRVAVTAVLVLILFGAIPQYIAWLRSYAVGTPQARLWEKNYACASNLDANATTHASFERGRVSAVMWGCPSGDVLVEVSSKDQLSGRRVWIPLDPDEGLASRFPAPVATAFAGEKQSLRSNVHVAQTVRVLCMKRLRSGFIKRRIQLPDGRCRDEVIDTSNGRVVNANPAPCSCESF